MLIIFALLAAPHAWRAWKFRHDSEEGQTYYQVPAGKKWEYGICYVALIAFLAVMTHDVHGMLGAARATGNSPV